MAWSPRPGRGLLVTVKVMCGAEIAVAWASRSKSCLACATPEEEPKTATDTSRSRCPSDPEMPCHSQPPAGGLSGLPVAPGTYLAKVAVVTSVQGGGRARYSCARGPGHKTTAAATAAA